MSETKLTKDTWVKTEHPRIFYKTLSDKHGSGMRIPTQFAEAFPDFDILVTEGPWRFHDISYETDRKNKVIHIDIYSVRYPSDAMVNACIAEIRAFFEGVEVGKKEGERNA